MSLLVAVLDNGKGLRADVSYRMRKLCQVYSGQFVSEGRDWYWFGGRIHGWTPRPLAVNP